MEDLLKFLASLFGIDLNPTSKPQKPLSGMNKMSGGQDPTGPVDINIPSPEKKEEKKKKDTW